MKNSLPLALLWLWKGQHCSYMVRVNSDGRTPVGFMVRSIFISRQPWTFMSRYHVETPKLRLIEEKKLKATFKSLMVIQSCLRNK